MTKLAESKESTSNKKAANPTNINLFLDNNSATVSASLGQLNFNKKQLEELRKQLDTLTDSLRENSSLFAKLSLAWGKLYWWQKILFGMILIVPLITTALIAHLPILLTISLFLLITYTISSLLLDNHHKYSQQDKEHLKKGLLSFATILVEIINALGKLHKQLRIEIEKLQQERELLSNQVDRLDQQINGLTEQTNTLANSKAALQIVHQQLEDTVEQLLLKTRCQANLIEEFTLELRQIANDAELKQKELSSQINALNETNDSLKIKLKKANQIADILKGSVQTLSGITITDKEQQANFKQRLEDFLTNKDLTLDHFAHSLLETEGKLRILEEEFKYLNIDHAALLDRQEIQVTRLERFTHSHTPIMDTVNQIGLFAKGKQTPSLEKQYKLLTPA
ncbi:hypothetical protein ACNVED_15480 (plasmid) [Legionella sp. D16C41]|uniref:hypothetical protein n=1 Tax=Legionella sp. D16C41 TaxID=3402688 RepID=UPI003AF7AAD9